MMVETDEGPVEPQRWIDETTGIVRRTRAARQHFWFPLVLLGILTLASTPLYFQHFQPPTKPMAVHALVRTRTSAVGLTPITGPQNVIDTRSGSARDIEKIDGRWYLTPKCAVVHGVVEVPCDGSYFANTYGYVSGPAVSPTTVGLYWLMALVFAYALIGLWHRRQARIRGVATSPVAFIITGLAVLILLVLTTPGMIFHHAPIPIPLGFGDGEIRGVLPIVSVAIGLIVLSRVERSVSLLVFALSFLGFAAVIDLYDLQNLVYRLGIHPAEQYASATGVCVAGIILTLAGGVYALIQARTEPLT